MQKYEQKPIPIVMKKGESEYEVNPEALTFLSSIQGKMAVISVAGLYRTGKSFLLNTMLLNQKTGFEVGPTTNPKTKGIWIWGKPLIFKNSQDEIINVIILDSEGLGSTEQDINHDLRLFSITLLLSSAFLYNTLGAIDQNAIDSLGLVLKLCNHLKNEKFHDFPDFYWILRDFSLALVDKDNSPLTTKMYLENCLSFQSNDSENRNQIRDSIKLAFTSRNCFTFVRPLTDEASLQNLDRMDLQQLRPEFVEQVLDFRKYIFNHLKIKSIKGREVTGNMMCELVKIYVSTVNGNKLPIIENGWEQLCLKQLHEVLDEIEDTVAAKVRSLKDRLPRTRKELQEQQDKLMEQFAEIFSKRLKNNGKAASYFGNVQNIVEKEMKKIESQMKTKNMSETQNFVKKEFQVIEKRLKQSQFKNMGQLVKQFQLFYEYFKKKCPYRDDLLIGMESLMKKFSDCSLMMYKNLQKKKDEEVQKLKKERDKLTSLNAEGEEKFKQEKIQLQNRNAVFETKIEEMNKNQEQLSLTISNLENTIEIMREEQCKNSQTLIENLENDNIELKKRILQLQNQCKEVQCSRSHEISSFQQKIMLLENQIQNTEDLKEANKTKYEQLFNEFQSFKEEANLQLSDVLKQNETQKEQFEKNQMSFKSELALKESENKNLEKTLEQKCIQMNNLKQNLENELKESLKKFEEEKSKLIQEREQQINFLNSTIREIQKKNEGKFFSVESQLAEKENLIKTQKLQQQQEKAIFQQRIQFLMKQKQDYEEKIRNLVNQNQNYINIFEEKDQEITQLETEIEDLKKQSELQNTQLAEKIKELHEQIQEKNSKNRQIEKDLEKLIECERRNKDKIRQKNQEIQKMEKKIQQDSINSKRQFDRLKQEKEVQMKEVEGQIETLKGEHTQHINNIKQNAQLSLMQLKNFYQMEKERLGKKLLEQRKKYEINESNIIKDYQNKCKGQIKSYAQQINQLKLQNQNLQEQIRKMQSEYEVKTFNLEQELQNQRKQNESKFDSLKKKNNDLSEELDQISKQHEQEQIEYMKRIETLSFELSRKQKEIIQINVKKQSLESSLTKKETQLSDLKKSYNQQIENNLKKISQTQSKVQKINEQYMEFKIEADRENALAKQRNQFLATKMNDLMKEKEIGNSKNLQKLDRIKINELKQQLQKHKAEIINLQTKNESLRKSLKQSQMTHRKQRNHFQKQYQYLSQKLELAETKNKQLESTITMKNQKFAKQLQETRLKHQEEKSRLVKQIDTLKDKVNEVQQERNELSWKLQKDMALIGEKIKHVQYQRDQSKKELFDTQKRLQLALNQIKKNTQKTIEQSGIKKQSIDKRYSHQLQVMKMTSKVKLEELEQSNKRLKEQNSQLRERNFDTQERLSKAEKTRFSEKNLIEQLQSLKRQKQNLILTHRNQLTRENDDSRKKYQQLEKRYRQLDRKNSQSMFQIEKVQAKYKMQIDKLQEENKKLSEQIAWHKQKMQKSKIKSPTTSEQKRFSMTVSDVLGWK